MSDKFYEDIEGVSSDPTTYPPSNGVDANTQVKFPAGEYLIDRPLVFRNVNASSSVDQPLVGSLPPAAQIVDVYGEVDPATGELLSKIKLHSDFFLAQGQERQLRKRSKQVGIALIGCKGVVFRDLVIEGDNNFVDDWPAPSGGPRNPKALYGFVISGSSRCQLRNVTFKSFSGNGTGNYGGCQLTIVATEDDHLIRPDSVLEGYGPPKLGGGGEYLFASFPNIHPTTLFMRCEGMSSEDNLIYDCKFLDPHAVANFGVRVKTDWKIPGKGYSPLPDGSTPAPYQFFVKGNELRDCEFIGSDASGVTQATYWHVNSMSAGEQWTGFQGGFNDNAIEVGGPATQHNKVVGCTFKNTRFTPLECDKGARENQMVENVIDRVWPQVQWNSNGGLYVQYSPGRNTIGMRDGGFGSPVNPAEGKLDGFEGTHYTYKNIFRDNTIRNIYGSKHLTGGMELLLSKKAVVQDNVFEAAMKAQKDTPTETFVPSLFLLKKEVWNLRVEGNVVSQPTSAFFPSDLPPYNQAMVTTLPLLFVTRADDSAYPLVFDVQQTAGSEKRQPIMVNMQPNVSDD